MKSYFETTDEDYYFVDESKEQMQQKMRNYNILKKPIILDDLTIIYDDKINKIYINQKDDVIILSLEDLAKLTPKLTTIM